MRLPLTSHLRYLRYVIKHKSYVYKAGRMLGVPWWRLLIHDWQKFAPQEWRAYACSFFGPWPYKERPPWLVEAFDYAWLHHQRTGGEHHWNSWLLQGDGGCKALRMPEVYVREMVADWAGAGRAITGTWEVSAWYAANRDKIQLHPDTRVRVEQLLAEFEYRQRPASSRRRAGR